MNGAKVYGVNKDDVTYRITDGEVVILRLDNGNYYSLNETGTLIWEGINKRRCLGDILTSLKQKYFLPEQQLEQDLKEVIKDLQKEKLIVDKAP